MQKYMRHQCYKLFSIIYIVASLRQTCMIGMGMAPRSHAHLCIFLLSENGKATTVAYSRKMPGRIIGVSVDSRGK
jgi:hypothetical protein